MGATRTGDQFVVEKKVGQKVRIERRERTDIKTVRDILIDHARIQSDCQWVFVDVDHGNHDRFLVGQRGRIGRLDSDRKALVGLVIEGFQCEKLVSYNLKPSVVGRPGSADQCVSERVSPVRIAARQGPYQSTYGFVFRNSGS